MYEENDEEKDEDIDRNQVNLPISNPVNKEYEKSLIFDSDLMMSSEESDLFPDIHSDFPDSKSSFITEARFKDSVGKKDKINGPKSQEYSVILKEVVDGDTIKVVLKDSQDHSIIKVRMVYIDTPEMKQSFGLEAKDHLKQLLSQSADKSLTLVVTGQDMYGRSLGVIKRGSVDINKQMVADGFAWCYLHSKCPSSYITATQEAQNRRKGLFIQENPRSPWEWRKNKNN